MKMLKSILILTLGALSLVSTAHAASMVSPKVELEFYSKDGVPVEGISLAGMLRYKVLTTKDCTGFICMPSLPKYKMTSDGGQVLGQTDANGRLSIQPMKWKTSSLTAKELGVSFFTNGTISDLCNDGTASYYQDFLDLLPQWNGTQPVERNAECGNVEALEGDNKTVNLVCYSPYTHSEIEALRNKILSGCPKK